MKIMITTRGDFVSPRFDRTPEVLIATCYDRQLLEEPRSIILSDTSAEIICDLALVEKVTTVICGGIEELHYQFLTWKKIRVIDSIIGFHADALERIMINGLKPGTILPGVISCEVIQ